MDKCKQHSPKVEVKDEEEKEVGRIDVDSFFFSFHFVVSISQNTNTQ